MSRKNDTSGEKLGQWCDCEFCARFPAIAQFRRLVMKGPVSKFSPLLRAVVWELGALEAEQDNRPADALIYHSYAWAVICREAA